MNGLAFAGFWRRVAAFVLDEALIMFVSLQFRTHFIADSLPHRPRQIQFFLGLAAFWPVVVLFRWCYFAAFESSPLRATPGKLAAGLYVTDTHGERLTFGRATGRYFAKILSALPLGVGFIMAGLTPKKQALHDLITECLVLRK